jgi:membrane protein DedA with SNARE-associated domain
MTPNDMQADFGFLFEHRYTVLFVLVLVDQLGIPIPAAVPLLIAAGAYAAIGQVGLVGIVCVTIAASLAAHIFWYELARRGRGDILGLLCRLSLEPDLCARGAREFFVRWGPAALVLAYFMPGFAGVVAQPIAAVTGMPRRRFLALNVLGALLWVTVYVGVGYLFSSRIASVLHVAARLGGTGLQVVAGLVIVYVGWKLVRRNFVYRRLRIARITPAELKRRLDAHEPTFILDLRHALEFAGHPEIIPGALRMSPEDLDRRFGEIPTNQEIVLYCT